MARGCGRKGVAEADVRWQQRFANFQAAVDQLEGFFEPPALNEREQQGLIKAFEYCFELGWSTLRLAFSHAYNRATADQIAAQVEGGCRYSRSLAGSLRGVAWHPGSPPPWIRR